MPQHRTYIERIGLLARIRNTDLHETAGLFRWSDAAEMDLVQHVLWNLLSKTRYCQTYPIGQYHQE